MPVIVADKIAFLHIPKTGGMWVRDFLRRNNLPHEAYVPDFTDGGIEKILLKKSESHHIAALPTHIAREDVYMFVREPAQWYKSLYLFREYSEKWQWDYSREFDKSIEGKTIRNLDDFVDRTLSVYPDGILGRIYDSYQSISGRIMKMESMESLMVRLFGAKIKLGGKINVRRRDEPMSLHTKRLIRRAEPHAFDYWKYAR